MCSVEWTIVATCTAWASFSTCSSWDDCPSTTYKTLLPSFMVHAHIDTHTHSLSLTHAHPHSPSHSLYVGIRMLAIVAQPVASPASVNPSITIQISHIIMKLLQKNAAYRYQSGMHTLTHTCIHAHAHAHAHTHAHAHAHAHVYMNLCIVFRMDPCWCMYSVVCTCGPAQIRHARRHICTWYADSLSLSAHRHRHRHHRAAHTAVVHSGRTRSVLLRAAA